MPLSWTGGKLPQCPETGTKFNHYERAARLGVSRSGICDAMKRIGITIKKTLTHPKAREAERTAFQERIAAHEAAGKPICLY